MRYLKTTLLAASMLTVFIMLLPLFLIMFAFSFWRMRQVVGRFRETIKAQQDYSMQRTVKGECIDGEFKVIRD